MGVAPRAGGAGVGSTSGTHRPTTWAAAARGDRSTGWLRWDRFGPDPTAGAGPEGLCSTTWAGARSRLCSLSVSYTHLRAHETVLDLVCRLLLEKKKKYKNEIKIQ